MVKQSSQKTSSRWLDFLHRLGKKEWRHSTRKSCGYCSTVQTFVSLFASLNERMAWRSSATLISRKMTTFKSWLCVERIHLRLLKGSAVLYKHLAVHASKYIYIKLVQSLLTIHAKYSDSSKQNRPILNIHSHVYKHQLPYNIVTSIQHTAYRRAIRIQVHNRSYNRLPWK